MKPNEHAFMPVQETQPHDISTTHLEGESTDNQEVITEDAQAQFEDILTRVQAETDNADEIVNRLYIAKEEALHGRQYALHSKIGDEIEKRETLV